MPSSVEAKLPTYIDSTMLSCFRSCPQKFYDEYVLGLRPSATSIDLHAGACFSSALERFYEAIWVEGVDIPTALGRALQKFELDWGDYQIKEEYKGAKTKDQMWAAVEDYVQTYPPRTDHIQPYFGPDGKPTFEFSFAIPLEPSVNPPEYIDGPAEAPSRVRLFDHSIGFPLHPSGAPFSYVGRLDLLGVWNNKIVGRDEKTAARLEGNWTEKWDMRAQFLGYCWALQQYGMDVDTIAVRGVIITKTMIRQVEAIKSYARFEITRWHEQMRRDLWKIRRCWDEGYWDYNLGESCVAYSHCPFMPMCKSPEPSRWHNNYVVKRWNPLDRNPVGSDGPQTAAKPVPVPGGASGISTESASEKAP